MAIQELTFAVVDEDAPNRRVSMSVESADVAQSVGEQLNCTIPGSAPAVMALIGLFCWQSTVAQTQVDNDPDDNDVALIQLLRDGSIIYTTAVKTAVWILGSFNKGSFQERVRFPGQRILPGDVISVFMHPVDGGAGPTANLTVDAEFLVLER